MAKKHIYRTHKHPNPEQWANYLSICGIDKGVFSTLTALPGGAFKLVFQCGITIKVIPGKLQKSYTL